MSATPSAYNPTTDFSDHSDNFPTTPHSGANLDVELANIETAIDETQARLLEIQNDDGSVKNASVGLDQLKTEVSNLLGGAGSDNVTNDSSVSGATVSDALDAVKATADAALPKAGGALTGPVTTTSTIDGRDVSADGAVIDGLGTSSTHDVAATGDATSGQVVKGDDSRLTDSRTPSAHAASHTDGTDDIATASAITKGLMSTTAWSKLDGIETGADVTDETNVVGALNGAVLTDVGTPASTDKILLQDGSDSDNLKYADFSEFSGGGGSWSGFSDNGTITSTTSLGSGAINSFSRVVPSGDIIITLPSSPSEGDEIHFRVQETAGDSVTFEQSGGTDLLVTKQSCFVGFIYWTGDWYPFNYAVPELASTGVEHAAIHDDDRVFIRDVSESQDGYVTVSDLLAHGTAHAANHISGGADAIDGDQIDISWVGYSEYAPSVSPTEVSSSVHLTAHLAGIDDVLGTHQMSIDQNISDISQNTSDINTHTFDTSNPHLVTAAQVGLGNVENIALTTGAATLSNKAITNPEITDQTLSDGATVNWDADSGSLAILTLGGNRTIAAPTNLKTGTYVLILKQDATGSRTVTWNSVFKWSGGTAPTLSTGANAVDIITFVCDATNLYGVEVTDFS